MADLTPRHTHADQLARLDKMIGWAERHAADEAAELRRHREFVREDEAGEAPWGAASETGRAVWNDRLRRDAPPPSTAPTVGQLARSWIEGEQAKAAAGLIKPRSYSNNRVNCLHFAKFVSEHQAPSAITEKTVVYRLWVLWTGT